MARAATKYDPPGDLYPPLLGAEKLDNGLATQVLRQGLGGGERPTQSSKVTVHYTGWNSRSGQMFDSSYLRNNPATFEVRETIIGYAEGIRMMEVGEKRRIWIPASLGYGEDDLVTPSKGDLVFDVELLKVEDPGQAIIYGFGAAAGVLLLLSLLFSATSVEPERPEYDVQRPFSIRPMGM